MGVERPPSRYAREFRVYVPRSFAATAPTTPPMPAHMTDLVLALGWPTAAERTRIKTCTIIILLLLLYFYKSADACRDKNMIYTHIKHYYNIIRMLRTAGEDSWFRASWFNYSTRIIHVRRRARTSWLM